MRNRKARCYKTYRGNRFSLGEPSGINTDRLKILSDLFIKGGLKAPQKKNLRDEIWIKLWGNCSFNPISAITGASLDIIGNDPSSRNLIKQMMEECQKVGEAVGVNFGVSIDKRIDGLLQKLDINRQLDKILK